MKTDKKIVVSAERRRRRRGPKIAHVTLRRIIFLFIATVTTKVVPTDTQTSDPLRYRLAEEVPRGLAGPATVVDDDAVGVDAVGRAVDEHRRQPRPHLGGAFTKVRSLR